MSKRCININNLIWPIIQVYNFITISLKYQNKMSFTCEIHD
jgi:hypothetical protein